MARNKHKFVFVDRRKWIEFDVRNMITKITYLKDISDRSRASHVAAIAYKDDFLINFSPKMNHYGQKQESSILVNTKNSSTTTFISAIQLFRINNELVAWDGHSLKVRYGQQTIWSPLAYFDFQCQLKMRTLTTFRGSKLLKMDRYLIGSAGNIVTFYDTKTLEKHTFETITPVKHNPIVFVDNFPYLYGVTLKGNSSYRAEKLTLCILKWDIRTFNLVESKEFKINKAIYVPYTPLIKDVKINDKPYIIASFGIPALYTWNSDLIQVKKVGTTATLFKIKGHIYLKDMNRIFDTRMFSIKLEPQ